MSSRLVLKRTSSCTRLPACARMKSPSERPSGLNWRRTSPAQEFLPTVAEAPELAVGVAVEVGVELGVTVGVEVTVGVGVAAGALASPPATTAAATPPPTSSSAATAAATSRLE